MQGSDSTKLPTHSTLDELVDFFDSTDMGDYLEQMPEVEFEIYLKTKKHLIEIEEDVIEKLAEIAKEKQVPTETLVNAWLKERITSSSEHRVR